MDYFSAVAPVNCCASTHFGENQLALGSSGISPLTTTHLLILQHQLAFATALVVSLNQATAYESRLILQQARGQSPELSSSSHYLGAYGFMFYFTPRWGLFSPFPHGTTSLLVTQESLALQGGPC
ncbi:hypothetical protein VNO78_12241 [Psophocarpus tetragonolobus]|uniref:Uncharacterized protein n=1 Tax=Psophocarpus tetragonolobus TaxID=3891 RepID=A0AAN9SN11_PSOTE